MTEEKFKKGIKQKIFEYESEDPVIEWEVTIGRTKRSRNHENIRNWGVNV